MNSKELLINKLDLLTSRPLKVKKIVNERIGLFQAQRNYSQFTSTSDVKLNKNGKLYTFESEVIKRFDFIPGRGFKSQLIKAQVAEISLYERKSIIYAQHIFVGYELYLSSSLGRGYHEDYKFPQIVDSKWEATPIQKDPKYELWVADETEAAKYSGGGSPAYFGGIWEDAD